MTRQQLLDRIQIDTAICAGKPTVRGTRVWVSLVLDLLASGESMESLLAEYPTLTREDLLACIAYGAEMSRDRYIEIAQPDRNQPSKKSA